jgi:hypothetical protein
MNKCSKTRKVRFRSDLDAKIALARRQWADKGERRSYRCPFCRGWHLTSQEQRAA